MVTVVSNRRAISPVIATVLLIVITVSLFGIIYAWSRSFIKEETLKFGGTAKSLCSQVNLKITNTQKGSNNISMHLDNVGNINVYKIMIQFVGPGIKKAAEYSAGSGDAALSAGMSIDQTFNVATDINLGSVNKLIITPVLLGKGAKSGDYQEYECNGYETEVPL